MTETEVDKEALQEEIGQIKRAMGLAEDHPYWVRSWLVEGIGVGILFPLFQLGLRDGFEPWLIAVLVVTFSVYLLVARRIRAASDEPATGLPSWTTWHVVVFSGMAALIVGLGPIFDLLDGASSITLAMVIGGTLVGVGYMFMGQLLEAYDVRRTDQYAFYIGGGWILLLVAIIPHVSLFEGWEYAVLGIGIAAHGVVTSLVLSRI